jgi:hypothetical protein
MHRARASRGVVIGLVLGLLGVGCSMYEIKHEIQWDSAEQTWRSDFGQVQTRAAQTRVYDTLDRLQTLEAVVATIQDLGFQVDVVDTRLGIVSGKRFESEEREKHSYDPLYHIYDGESLLIFTKEYRTWGPFWHRSDLVRITVSVRPRGESQLVVRASAQYALRPVEQPEIYQAFFATLATSMFVEEQLLR